MVNYVPTHIVLDNQEWKLVSMFDLAISDVGTVGITTTEYKGHDPEFWAKEATDRIISIGDKSHPAIREQAEAFKNHVYSVILYNIKEAIKSDRTTLSGVLEKNQQKEMADIIRRL